jgi:signal transduction histidine kinase
LIYNFSKYDDNFLEEDGEEKELYLEDLKVILSQSKPSRIVEKEIILGATKRVRKPHGTIIEISDLKTKWTKIKVSQIQKEIGKLQPIFSELDNSDFSVWIYKDLEIEESQDKYRERLINCLDNKSVFKVTDGKYCSSDNQIRFKLNDRQVNLSFTDPDINGLKEFATNFGEHNYKTECGSFRFEFYIFDFEGDSQNPTKYYLSREEKQTIKEHRTYLYRDGIRVMPYGDPTDDWLRVDMDRGTVKAGQFLSNDQIVGCVYITQKENPKLIDKTNREGLIEDGRALEDFITVIRLVLQYLRKKPFEQYRIEKQRKKEVNSIKQGRPLVLIQSAKEKYVDNKNVTKFLNSFEKSYVREKKVLEDRIIKTENLAAVGLSIETASHDVMLLIDKTKEQVSSLVRNVNMEGKLDKNLLSSQLMLIVGNISMIEMQMKDIQILFPSTKSRTKNINVKEIIDKVYTLYGKTFSKENISVSFDVARNPLIARTTDAVLLQVFINLFDNALYWLKTIEGEKEIHIKIDGDNQRLIFSDNGPGIKDDDKNYIFEAFYSGKGEEGRGLGLYIARQLLDRYDYTINLAEISKDRVLPGANFVLEFMRGE